MEENNLKKTENQKMFTRPFSFKGRIRRLDYGLSYLVYLVFYNLFIGALAADFSVPVYIVLCVLGIVLFWFVLAQGVKRCHDRGNSGWYQLIPFYVLVMLFGDGDDYDNGYGPDPKGRDCMAEIGL